MSEAGVRLVEKPVSSRREAEQTEALPHLAECAHTLVMFCHVKGTFAYSVEAHIK